MKKRLESIIKETSISNFNKQIKMNKGYYVKYYLSWFTFYERHHPIITKLNNINGLFSSDNIGYVQNICSFFSN